MSNNIKLIVLDNFKEFGNKINQNLMEHFNTKESFIVSIDNNRFSNGEGKVKLNESIRNKDVYILSDIGNYSVSYLMHGNIHYMSPDEHFQDIKRVISATCGLANKIVLIMPLLYQSRQHKRKGRESLDCSIALQELEALGVNQIITYDAHDPSICNSIPKLAFDNFYPTKMIVDKILKCEKNIISNSIVVSPDMGATERAKYYAEVLHLDVGIFYKRRDLTKIVNGKNPIVEHVYVGPNVKNKNIIIVDDMIASGQSVLDTAKHMKESGANKVFIIATFAFFTEGIEKIEEYYTAGYFDKLYTTNLSYVNEIIKNKQWYVEVDCSKHLTKIILSLIENKSLTNLF